MIEIGLIVLVIALTPFFLNALAKLNLFFTTLESGDIKFVMRGNTLHKIINDTPKMIIVDGMEKKSLFNKVFGLYGIGLPPFAGIHEFPIVKEKENPSGKTPETWVKTGEEITVSSLRSTFPRPFVLLDVELKDESSVHVLVSTKLEVVNPFIPVFNFKGRFFDNAGGIIAAAVSDILKESTLQEFVDSDKGEVGGILKKLKEPETTPGSLNAELVKQVGLRLVGISIPKYDPGTDDLRTAMNAKAVATLQGEAKTIAAEAEAKAQERLAQARGARVRETMTALTLPHSDPNTVTNAAATILEMEAAAGPDSKLTTVVKGGGASAVIPVGGGKS